MLYGTGNCWQFWISLKWDFHNYDAGVICLMVGSRRVHVILHPTLMGKSLHLKLYKPFFMWYFQGTNGHSCCALKRDVTVQAPVQQPATPSIFQIQTTKNKETPRKWDVFHGHCHPSKPLLEASGCWIQWLSQSARLKEFYICWISINNKSNYKMISWWTLELPGQVFFFRLATIYEGSLTCKLLPYDMIWLWYYGT